ncbi:uncharacterized protein LOC131604347 [Vicia villosa]|uniref:uncharacterized protein LOC131604347 n=1 Tax=Vicia villosa TaxID=3911 RepID=UPI00273C63A1|nr:uncharacterized protein LOC131604347 [Vicia villosa]
MTRNNNPVPDPLDPYYVHPSDNSSTVYVAPPLSGDNYHAWSMKMRRALAMKNKFQFVDGTIEIPDRFMRGDKIRVAQLYQEITNLKQGSKKISDYFTELRSLWEELDQYRPVPSCTCCVTCAFLAMRNSRSFRAEDRIIQFLIGLNEEFHGVVSQVLLMDPLPPINKVFSMVLQQERKICGTIFPPLNATEDGSGMVNAVEGKQGGRGRGYNNAGRGRGNGKVCTYCGKPGHTVDNCYKKHGYPPNLGRGSASYANQAGASSTQSQVDKTEGKSTVGTTSDNGSMALTKEQYHNLMVLLEKNSGSVNLAKGGKETIEEDWFS